MAERHTVSKVLFALFRLGECISAVIVLGILSRFTYLANLAGVHVDGRIIYTMVTACLGIVYTILTCIPIGPLVITFPFDTVLFIMWLVAFCLLESRTGVHACSSTWYNNYWGYYWGRWWRTGPVGVVRVNNAGCSDYRTVLAFSFIACIIHIGSTLLGGRLYRAWKNRDRHHEVADVHEEKQGHFSRLRGRKAAPSNAPAPTSV
uniref:MARVEL domain-containing protein n=1 Tax=Bionectria ochroleuca TaxID=29856 RepID=A0A8H7K4E3_BIOOC